MPPLKIELSTRFRAEARTFSEVRQQEINGAVAALPDAFGHPHRHAGLGLRRLQKDFFEFRVGRDLRVVFKLLDRDSALLALIGNHDDVRRFLKNL